MIPGKGFSRSNLVYKYQLYLPNKEELRKEIEALIGREGGDDE